MANDKELAAIEKYWAVSYRHGKAQQDVRLLVGALRAERTRTETLRAALEIFVRDFCTNDEYTAFNHARAALALVDSGGD